jgi:hypothetical protein
MNLCGDTTTYDGKIASFTEVWTEFAPLERVAFFPWPWAIQYDPAVDYRPPPLPGHPHLPLPKCPSEANKILSFAAINISVFTFSLVLGRRTVIYKLTCRIFGKPKGSAMWISTSLFFLGLSLAANFLNAYIIRSAPGFSNISITDLVLLWCARPRLAWSAALLVFVDKERGEYFTAGASGLLSEITLQAIGAVYLCRTVNFAARHGLYHVGRAGAVVPGWTAALTMYTGALLWIVAVAGATFQIIYSFSGLPELVRRAFGLASEKPGRVVRRQRDRAVSSMRRYVAERVVAWYAVSMRLLMHTATSSYRLRPAREFVENGGAEVSAEVAVRRQSGNRVRPGNGEETSGILAYDWLEALEAMGLDEDKLKRMRTVVFLMIPPFLGQWLFWGGFIQLAGDRYV